MSDRIICQLLLLLTWIPLHAAAEGDLCDRPLLIGWEPWPPYQYLNNSGTLTGVDIDMANTIMAELKCPVEFQQTPWKRHLQALQDGLLDIALGASKTPEREEYAHFSTPYRQELNSLFILRDLKSTPIRSLQEFLHMGKRLGVTLGYFYGQELQSLFDKKEYHGQLSYVRDNIQLYQMLDKRRIDGFLADALTVSYQSKQFPEIYRFRPVLHANASPIFFMLSKKTIEPAFVEKLNSTLEDMKSSGTLFNITNQYLLPEHMNLP